LSEMAASLLAFADKPATPAFREEEMVMDKPFCCTDPIALINTARSLTAD